MKRKWLALAAVCAVMNSGCGEKERYTYTRTDRIAYPWSQAMMIHAPGMELNTCLAELIAEVEICSDRQTDRYTLSGEVPVTVSWYEARIRDVWYGDAVDDEIQVWFMGDDSRLHLNDRIILYATYGGEENYYVPVDGEASVFILNPPDDTVFSYSMISDYENLDGSSPEELREETEAILAQVAAGNGPVANGYIGGAAEDYIEKNAVVASE